MAPSNINLNQNHHDDDEILITFSDIAGLIKSNKKKIALWSLSFAVILFLYALTKPVQYEAEATFKEKGMARPGLDNYMSITMMMLRENTQESHAMTMMQSRRIIEELIKNQHLQASITKNTYTFPFIPFETIKNNIKSELGFLKNREFPILNDQDSELKVTDIAYDGEVPKSLQIKVSDDTSFEVKDDKKNIGNGKFGTVFKTEGFSFTLNKLVNKNLNSSTYTLRLSPLQATAKANLKKFTILPDKEDKTIIKIQHLHEDRFQAAKNVNALMALYQKYIYDDHCKLCDLQTAYLVRRQTEMAGQLETIMQNYASDLSSDLSTTGFASSEKAMEYLAATQQELKRKLFTINLELQRLNNAELDPSFDGELFSSTAELDVFNKIAGEKRQLKQVYDTLNLAMRGIKADSKEFHDTFLKQLSEQETNKQLLNESKEMLLALKYNELPKPLPALSGNPKFLVKEWHQKLKEAKNHFDNNASDLMAFDEWQSCKDGFCSYLERLNHYFKVNQRNIEERLANQQSPNSPEYSGINLEIAKELYMNYSKELCNLESTTKEREFIAQAIDNQNFEITSLSSVLNDPVSTEMIHRANVLLLEIKDLGNRSTKEYDRLLGELEIQKGFLKNHLLQSISILNLQQDLLRKKIKEIQNVNFSLVQEELAILENQLKDYLSVAISNLTDEQNLLNQNLAEIRSELAALPHKFTKEQLIDHQMGINKTLMEEISKLVESKNVSNNLATFQSAPVDISYPPLNPKPPRLILFSILGAFLGALLGLAWVLTFSIVDGLKVTKETLTTCRLNVSGTISKNYQEFNDQTHPLDNDLDTLRRLVIFIMEASKKNGSLGTTFALIEGKNVDYSAILGNLFFRKGLKTAIVHLDFSNSQNSQGKGLLQYLEDNASFEEIIKKGHVDQIYSGGVTRYANELISSKAFSEAITALEKEYDFIIVVSKEFIESAEVENLLNKFQIAAVTIKDEPIKDLKNIISLAKKPDHHITFIFNETDS